MKDVTSPSWRILRDIREQATPVSGVRSQGEGSWLVWGAGEQGTLGRNGNGLDLDGGQPGTCIYEKAREVHLTFVHFTACRRCLSLNISSAPDCFVIWGDSLHP